MRSSLRRRLSAACAALALAAAGCGAEETIEVAEWTLVAGGREHAVRLPAKVDAMLEARPGSYDMRSEVDVPAELRRRPLTLAIPRLPSPVDLRVDGEFIEPVNDEIEGGYRSAGPHRWRIPAAATDDGRLRLQLTVRDRWFQGSWIGSVARLSPSPTGDAWYRFVSRFNLAANLVATSVLGMIGLSYLVVFLGARRQHAYGWFAAQALSAVSYPLFMTGVPQWLLGDYDLRLVPGVAIAALVSVGYAHSHFALARPSRWWWVLSAAVAGVTVFGQGPYSARWTMWVVLLVVVSTAAYQIALCLRLLRHDKLRPDATLHLVAWVTLMLTAGLDLLYWGGFGLWQRGLQGASFGLTLFAVVQSIAFSRQHVQTMRETILLNAELHRQVSVRSRQLSHALARLGRPISADLQLDEGDVVDDRYRIVRRLGDGAMATVYVVERLEDGRLLALKQLRTVADARVLARFAREAHIASGIAHPNLISIHDIDFATSGFMYLVMELVEGGTLHDHKERYGDIEWALHVLRQIASGLLTLHDSGVVHRDLKPANVLLARRDGDVVKISDFGISGIADSTDSGGRRAGSSVTPSGTLPRDGRADANQTRISWRPPGPPPRTGGASAPASLEDAPNETAITRISGDPVASSSTQDPEGLLTLPGQILGTPAYMAPELVDGDEGSPTRDVFSFGVIAFELLCGRRPYPQSPLTCRLNGVSPPEPVRLAHACPMLDPKIAAGLQASISLVANERPSIAELHALLAKGA
jgi:serine/threonine protein kinase